MEAMKPDTPLVTFRLTTHNKKAATNAAAAPYFLTNLWNGNILFFVFSEIILLPP